MNAPNSFHHNAGDGAGARPLVNRGRASLVHGTLVLFALALIARAMQVQLVDGKFWAARAARQQITESDLPAARGQILDERGVVLAESRELVQIAIAPREVRRDRSKNQDDGPALARGLTQLGVPREFVRAALDTNRKWVEIPKLFVARDAAPVLKLRRGIHPRFAMQRQVSAPTGLKRLIGGVDASGTAVGGVEQELDSLLRGQTGRTAELRDGRGVVWETPALSGVDATAGHSVTLTINSTLQDICERELALALQRTGATGGDVVIVDPRDGSILALAGIRDGRSPLTTTPLAEGYEPGSVLKTFIVARLIDRNLVQPGDVVNTENGLYTVNGRSIEDEHKRPSMTVRDVIRFSSNIGIVKLATKFTSVEEYELLRDFGFGVQPGTPYPAESRGRVPVPRSWSAQTSASMAMGYELLVTPLQLAVAYASVANGGELLQPALVREIRDANGSVVFRHERRVLRRVLSPRAAESMRVILESVVDSGTATAAELKTFDVAGKSGTARRSERGTYLPGKYNATFAGMFPARQPQYVIVARLIDPKGQIFGGLVAAPLVNRILQGAVATRDVQLDRSALAAAAHPAPAPVDSAALHGARATRVALASPATRDTDLLAALDTGTLAVHAAPVTPMPAVASVVVALPYVPKPAPGPSLQPRLVPNIQGLDLREAVRTLHAAGFQVRTASGRPGRTVPAAGALARPGSTVVVETAK